MAEKESIKVSLGTTVCIFIIILLVVALGVVYYLGFVKNNEKISELEAQTVTLENDKAKLEQENQTKISKVTQTINEEENTKNDKYEEIVKELDGIDYLYVTDVEREGNSYTLKGVLCTEYTVSKSELDRILNEGYMFIDSKKYTISLNKETNEYELFDKDFNEYPLYKLTEINNNEYSLKCQAEITEMWKPTEKHMKITLDGSIPCDLNGEYEAAYKKATVKEIFDDYKHQDIEENYRQDNRTFIFNFENGKCVEVIDIMTSI